MMKKTKTDVGKHFANIKKSIALQKIQASGLPIIFNRSNKALSKALAKIPNFKMVSKPARPYGQTIAQLQYFLREGMKGVSIVYLTVQGTFYSPQAAKNLVNAQRKQFLRELKNISEMIFDMPTNAIKKIDNLIENYGEDIKRDSAAQEAADAKPEI